jgi:hypothetical protein
MVNVREGILKKNEKETYDSDIEICHFCVDFRPLFESLLNFIRHTQ